MWCLPRNLCSPTDIYVQPSQMGSYFVILNQYLFFVFCFVHLIPLKLHLLATFTQFFMSGTEEDATKLVLHLSLRQQLDFVRWNHANQDEVWIQTTLFQSLGFLVFIVLDLNRFIFIYIFFNLGRLHFYEKQ